MGLDGALEQGAVVGNQLKYGTAGQGAAVGAGFGFISGALTGMTYDQIEGTQLYHKRQLASLKIQNATNARHLSHIQDQLDSGTTSIAGSVYQVFFDVDATNLRSGAIANLEVITDSIKGDSNAFKIHVVGHSDDSGAVEYNKRLAEARARTVSSYLASNGVSIDQIVVNSFGAKRPIATNSTPVGRQLNRRVDVYISR